MVNGKQKGAEGEREVVALLRQWWGAMEPEVEFARTPGSGGWQGQNHRGEQLRGKFRMSGDVMTTSPTFPFSVEVKRRENWTMGNLLAGKSGPVWDWWRQCQKAADESTPPLVPMVWLRHNREPWGVMLPAGFAALVPGLLPLIAWTPRQLLSVDVGPLLPALFKGASVLLTSPRWMVEVFGRWDPKATTTRVVVGEKEC